MGDIILMPKPSATWSPLDQPLIWRSLIKHLNMVMGCVGPYVDIHDAIVIGEFCEAFNIPISAVSERLEAYCHSAPAGIN
jgi:hypothetical protein